MFNKNTKNFYYILNEEEEILSNPIIISDDVIIEKRSKFAYYLDKDNQNRKILIGVYGKNVMTNSYYDGPFDQLADNYIDSESTLSEAIQLAYPYTKGLVDEYGTFLHDDGFRVAIMPYYIYESEYELIELVEGAKWNAKGDEFYSIITYDFQKEMDADLEFDLVENTLVFHRI